MASFISVYSSPRASLMAHIQDMLSHAVKLANGQVEERNKYELLCEDNLPLTPHGWLQLMSNESEAAITLLLRPKTSDGSRLPRFAPRSEKRADAYSIASHRRPSTENEADDEQQDEDFYGGPSVRQTRPSYDGSMHMVPYQVQHSMSESSFEAYYSYGPESPEQPKPSPQRASQDVIIASLRQRSRSSTGYSMASVSTHSSTNEDAITDSGPMRPKLLRAPVYHDPSGSALKRNDTEASTGTSRKSGIHPASRELLRPRPVQKTLGWYDTPVRVEEDVDEETGQMVLWSRQARDYHLRKRSPRLLMQRPTGSFKAGSLDMTTSEGRSDRGDYPALTEDKISVDPSYTTGRMPDVVSVNPEAADKAKEDQDLPVNLLDREGRPSWWSRRTTNVTPSAQSTMRHRSWAGTLSFPARVRFAGDSASVEGVRENGSNSEREGEVHIPSGDANESQGEGEAATPVGNVNEREGEVDTPTPGEKFRAERIPFFKWRLMGRDKSTSAKKAHLDLQTVLDQVKRGMCGGEERTKTAYLRTFRCTKNEFLCRHGVKRDWCSRSSQRDSRKPHTREGVGRERARPEAESADASPGHPSSVRSLSTPRDGLPLQDSPGDTVPTIDETPGHDTELLVYTTAGAQPGATNSRPSSRAKQDPENDSADSCKRLMREVFDLTEAIMSAFVGNRGDVPPDGRSHDIYGSIWGAVDVIWRVSLHPRPPINQGMSRTSTYARWKQIIREGLRMRHNAGGPVRYTVRSFDNIHAILGDDSRSNSRAASWSDCPDCKGGKTYLTAADALNHIGAKHIKLAQEPSDPRTRPSDNQNFCWVTSPHEASDIDVCDWEGSSEVWDFIHRLKPISKLSDELYYYVARPHGPSSADEVAPSLLPTALISAFCGILASYLYLAKKLSLINRPAYKEDSDVGYDLRDSVQTINRHITNAFRRASNDLEKARLDIIMLCSTHREADCLRIQSVDIHLLSIAFVQNIQNFSLPGDKCQDFLQAYRRYLPVLRGRAIHRPQRRVFLDIQNFQEELDALRAVTDTQIDVAKKLLSLLYPGSFRVTNKTRLERYGAEYEFWKKVDKRLKDRLAELDMLTEQSRRLKDDVKQAIEILEEDHGKAIRVFTVVTLLFLPL